MQSIRKNSLGASTLHAVDSDKLRVKMDTTIDPLNAAGHHKSSPINIVIGKLTHPSVNVHDSLHLGRFSREAYEKNLPTGFYDTSMQVSK